MGLQKASSLQAVPTSSRPMSCSSSSPHIFKKSALQQSSCRKQPSSSPHFFKKSVLKQSSHCKQPASSPHIFKSSVLKQSSHHKQPLNSPHVAAPQGLQGLHTAGTSSALYPNSLPKDIAGAGVCLTLGPWVRSQ
eukprot:1162034-Pelagomonas_calceolata.AAC.2